MYGHASAAEILGRRIGEITPQDDPLNLAYHRAFIEGGYRLTDWETREADKHGNIKYFLNNETGIVEDGLFKRAWGTQRDVIERRLQETQKLESLGVLAGGIAHDFNNLLTSVLGPTCRCCS